MSELDPEFAEIVDSVGTRRAAILAITAGEVARGIRADADALGTHAIIAETSTGLEVLESLPPVTFGQSRFWRYQLAEAALRLAADIARWGAPLPRCTGEEMVLHVILRHAATTDTGLPTAAALAWPEDEDDPDTWGDLNEYLFQDHDVLMLYDLPADAIHELARGVNLNPESWFTEFTLPFPTPART